MKKTRASREATQSCHWYIDAIVYIGNHYCLWYIDTEQKNADVYIGNHPNIDALLVWNAKRQKILTYFFVELPKTAKSAFSALLSKKASHSLI